MKLSKSLVTIAGCAALTPLAYSDPYLGKIGDYVSPPLDISADIMVLGFAPEVRELVDRVQSSLENNKEWLQEYAMGLQPGEAAPYHQNFGVSESEYQTLVQGTRELSLTSAGKTQLSIKLRDDETLAISGLPGEAPFDTVVYEAVSDSILSSYGSITGSRKTSGTLGASADTAWTGRLWTFERKELDNKVSIMFAIGKMNNNKTNILIHEVNGTVDNQAIEYHYMLMWDQAKIQN